jgi:alkanesulfonate monooxygenase SsuD/methylene tetrahydromethanopterin reductase-like flavin-dependent oxidoreductase (luciferase family)
MELSVCMAAKVDDIDYAGLAEELGYARMWVADSPMIWSDCYTTMGLIAQATKTIGIGTGVAVAGLRLAPVTAAAHATVNRIAPGRVFCGIGSGNTAMRILGRKPMTIARFDEYLRELRPLLNGEEATLRHGDTLIPTRHVMQDAGFVAFEPRMPMYVSAFGPRSMALAARHGDGVVVGAVNTPEAMATIRQLLDAGAQEAGRVLDHNTFRTSLLGTMVVLEPGEAVDSDRVRAECGAYAMAVVHYSYEQWSQYGAAPPAVLAEVWDEYVAMLATVPAERRHLRTHLGHNCWVEPQEEQFLTASVLQAGCMIGTADELAARLDALSDAGLHEMMLLPTLATKEKVLRDVATKVVPLLRRRAPSGAVS